MDIGTVIQELGFPVDRFERVGGGDINQAFCLHANGRTYFLKINDAGAYPLLFEKEMAGLQELALFTTLKIPAVLKTGIAGGSQYLLMEWIAPAKPRANFWEDFGTALASFHLHPQPYFGWHNSNYIGSLVQRNEKESSWPVFYTNWRIMPLVGQLYNSGHFTREEIDLAELYCKRCVDFFPEEKRALLHGDLWSGNYMVAENGLAAIFDPAVYYGHREMDIGMTKLFGGFSEAFYAAYDNVYPLEKNWQQRLHFTQLYPLLVHAILFGDQYIPAVKAIIKKMR